MRFEVEFTIDGYLRLTGDIASQLFPDGGLVALVRGPEMWLMPTHGTASGGLLLKQRKARGDRSVLVAEELGGRKIAGMRIAFWDEAQGALRVALDAVPSPQTIESGASHVR
jgi:hydrogenase maturation protease